MFTLEEHKATSWRDEAAPTHRCKVCGALWRFWPRRDTGDDHDAWNLRSGPCGPCCDNAPMADQIEPLTMGALIEHIKARAAAIAASSSACGCREGECESKPTGCRMAAEVAAPGRPAM